MEGWPSVSELLRFYGCYARYELGRAVIAAELSMLRGRRVDLAAEYMALGATLPRAHCASHLKERATRRNDDTLSSDLRAAMIVEADEIAFNPSPVTPPIQQWIEKNQNCVCVGFLYAVLAFQQQHPQKLVEAQFTVINKTLRYTGHPDLLIQNTKGHYELLSVKTGEMPSFAGLQEALYLLADPVDFPWPVDRYNIRRAVVQFRADGGYTYKPLNDYQDLRDAEILAAAYHIARRINGECE